MSDMITLPPTAGKPNFLGIPQALRDLAQWVLHKAKIPHQSGGSKASVTNPNTWSTFADALAAFETGQFEGLSFVFTPEDPFFGVDLDSCRDPVTGELTPEAKEIVASLNTYTEVSRAGPACTPSARGSCLQGRRHRDLRPGAGLHDDRLPPCGHPYRDRGCSGGAR